MEPLARLEPAGDRSGETFGSYRLVAKLGEGGMGVVYRAVDERTDREVALKLLRPEHVGDVDRRKRFLRETRITAALDHPGIARLHEAGEANGEVFLAMDLAPGASLDATAGRMPVARAVALVRRIAAAVAHAHGKGIVHRDLKPSNVAVDGDDVRVLDFGLAKLRETDDDAALLYGAETESSMTVEGRILGTPAYMAPEQALGREVGVRADVFSLGVMLYELLTGVRPFTGASRMEIVVAVTRDRPAPPSTLAPDVPPALDALVLRCLEKQPSMRPTMAELEAALAAAATPEPRARRALARMALPAVLLVMLGGAVAAWSFASRRAPRATREEDAGAAAGTAAVTPDAAPIATSPTDLPLPASTSAAALAEVRAARADEQEGAIDAEIGKLQKAVELDPNLADAHLVLALRLSDIQGNNARAEFAEAVKLRHLLDARGQEILEAARPLFQDDPPDIDRWITQLRAVSDRRPGDVSLLRMLGDAYATRGDFATAVTTFQRALALDPTYGFGWSALSQSQAYLGQFDAARASIARCLAISPTGSWCIWVREFLDERDGNCAANEAIARHRIRVGPTLSDGYQSLFYALVAEGRPDALVDEALAQTLQRVPDARLRRKLDLRFSLRVAALRGDFTTALLRASELRAHASSRSDLAEHSDAAYQSALLEREVGHPERAAQLAGEFLERREAWTPDPVPGDYSLATDRTALIAALAFHTHGLGAEAYAAVLASYRSAWSKRLGAGFRPFVWVYGYAQTVETPAEAAEAMAAIPQFAPLPPWVPNGDLPDAGLGRTLWLGGRRAEGLAVLARAAGSCGVAKSPLSWVQVHAFLGDARAEDGDTAGACEAYAVVLAHWGHARPRSVTAEHARSRARALGCPEPAR